MLYYECKNMIDKKWKLNREDFSPYKEILISEKEENEIRKFPEEIMNKLFLITEAELSKKLLKEEISLEEAKGGIQFAKYLKNYFKN